MGAIEQKKHKIDEESLKLMCVCVCERERERERLKHHFK